MDFITLVNKNILTPETSNENIIENFINRRQLLLRFPWGKLEKVQNFALPFKTPMIPPGRISICMLSAMA